MNDLVFLMYERGFAWNTIRALFSWLDSVAYTLFAWVMQLIFDIAQVSASDAFDSFYSGIQERIYALLAIYMLFKITISMLTYLVNPDSITDKSSGVGKLSIRVVTSLVMLIAFPMAFNFLKTVQPHIMEALPRVILATDGSNSDLGSQMENVGKNIAFQTYNGVFFNTNCADLEDTGLCFAYGNTVSDAVSFINEAGENKDVYKYDYLPLVGFVVAIVLTLILLGYCVDVAIRVFKLIILQLIAPIPIISYMDPKSSKDGAFNKWIKMVISVWADLFIKLGVIYFVILIISELFTSGAIGDLAAELFGENAFRGGLVTLALIIGLLFFAKDAPKFICDAMGIKMGENGKLFGGLGKIMAAGALGAGAIGAAAAGYKASRMADVENGIADKNRFIRGLNRAKNVGAGLLGGIGGLGAGASAAVGAKDHHAKAVMDAMSKRNSTTLSYGASGSTALGRAQASWDRLWQGETAYDKDQRSIDALDAKVTAGKQLQEYLEDRAVKKGAGLTVSGVNRMVGIDSSGKAIMREAKEMSYSDFNSAWQLAQQRGDSHFSVNGEIFETNASATKAFEGDLKTAAGQAWANSSEGKADETLSTYQSSYKDAGGTADITNSDAVKKDYKKAEQESFGIKNSTKYRQNKANAKNSGK